MKILVAVPGNLHTVRMNRFVPEALNDPSSGNALNVLDDYDRGNEVLALPAELGLGA